MAEQRDRNWNFENEDDLLYAYMGAGVKNSEEDLAKIAAGKARYEVPHIVRMLDISPKDIVIDIGSGYGHIAKVLATQVKHYHCCDISDKMMNKCKLNTSENDNISYNIVPRGDLSLFNRAGVTKVFSNSVFIHLNLFDITIYLDQVYKVLDNNGLLYFNFQDSDLLTIENDPNFISMRQRYVADPQEITLMIWNSLSCIRGYARRCGFELKRSVVWKHCATSVTFQKIA